MSSYLPGQGPCLLMAEGAQRLAEYHSLLPSNAAHGHEPVSRLDSPRYSAPQPQAAP